MLCGYKILLFGEKREELVQTLKGILDDRLVVENRSRAGLQGGHEADSDDRKTEQLHVACGYSSPSYRVGGVAEIGSIERSRSIVNTQPRRMRNGDQMVLPRKTFLWRPLPKNWKLAPPQHFIYFLIIGWTKLYHFNVLGTNFRLMINKIKVWLIYSNHSKSFSEW